MGEEIELADIRAFISNVEFVFQKQKNEFNDLDRYIFLKSIVCLKIREKEVMDKSWRDMCRDISVFCKEMDNPKIFTNSMLEVLKCQKKILENSVPTKDRGENYIQKSSLMVRKRSPISVSVVEL